MSSAEVIKAETPRSVKPVSTDRSQSPRAHTRGAASPSTATGSPPRALIPVVDAEASVQKAFALTASANKLIEGGLHRCREWGEVRDLYFHAAALFQQFGLHNEAAEAFNNSAAICRVFGSELEVATAVSYAVDSWVLVDPMQAIALLKELLEIHHAGERPKQEAKAARDIAEIYERLGFEEEALGYYVHCNQLYGSAKCGEICRNFYLASLNKMAHIAANLKKYKEAVRYFELLAEAAVAGTRRTPFYMDAMFCWLCEAHGEKQQAAVAKAKVEFDRYQDGDKFFQSGVEHAVVRGIIEACAKGSLATFDDAEKRYRDYRTCDPWHSALLVIMRENLFQCLLPYM